MGEALRKSDCKVIEFSSLKTKAGDAKTRTHNVTHGRVEPIVDKSDIAKVNDYLKTRPCRYMGQNVRNCCMFIVGINLGLRAGDLLPFRYCDVVNSKGTPLTQFKVKEQKTGKIRYLTANKAAQKAVAILIADNPNWKLDDYIIKSRNGENQPISLRRMDQILKDVQQQLNLPYNLGSHSCRKTFGYWFFEENQGTPEALAYLSEEFNHSSERVTRRYIGLSEKRRKEMRENLNLGLDEE